MHKFVKASGIGIVAELIRRIGKLTGRVDELENRNRELEEQYKNLRNQSSRNSSQPPNKDWQSKPNTNKDKPAPKPASRGKKKKKKPSGGQKGHKGQRLKAVKNPDWTQCHRLETTPGGAQLKDEHIVGWEERQVFELPRVTYEVTAHRRAVYKDPETGEILKAPFPEGVKAATSYGPNIKALALNLHVAHLIPLQRTARIIRDLFGLPMSEGTIVNAKQAAEQNLQTFQQEAVEQVIKEPRLNCDESGLRVMTQLHWCHIYATENLCLFFGHQKRGREAMLDIGILPQYMGHLIVDFFASYRTVAVLAALYYCVIHLVRELRAVHEQTHQEWSAQLIEHLYNGLDAVARKQSPLSKSVLGKWDARFEELLNEGAGLNPEPVPPPPEKRKRGRIKRTKARNLINRLQEHKAGYTGYLIDIDIPFTNNDAERPIRMIKVQQKVSGCFRTLESCQNFLLIRGYFETLRKNGRDVLEGTRNAIIGRVPSITQITAT